jgi:hypothetical protein
MIKRFALLTALAASLLAVGSGAWAQAKPATPAAPASAPAKASPKAALIAKILVLQQPSIENMARGMIEQPAAQLMQQVGMVIRQRVPEDKREEVAREIQGDARKYVEETLPSARERALKLAPTTIGPILEEQFTVDELKQVLALLESPLNRKYQAAAGEIQRALSEKFLAESRPLVGPKIQAMEQAVSQRLAPYMAAPRPASAAGK